MVANYLLLKFLCVEENNNFCNFFLLTTKVNNTKCQKSKMFIDIRIREKSNFIIFLSYHLSYVLTVRRHASGDGVQRSFLSDRSLLKHLYIYIYQLYISYHMNSVRVLSVKSAENGDRAQCSFLSHRSLSKHLHTQVNFSLLSICNRRSV